MMKHGATGSSDRLFSELLTISSCGSRDPVMTGGVAESYVKGLWFASSQFKRTPLQV